MKATLSRAGAVSRFVGSGSRVLDADTDDEES